MWSLWLLEEKTFKSYWGLLPVHPSPAGWPSAVCLRVQESIDFPPNCPACRAATRSVSRAETKQTRLTLCVVIQASFKRKDLCLSVPTNITGIRLMEADQGSPYLFKRFSLHCAVYHSISHFTTICQNNQSINQMVLALAIYLLP